MPLDIKLNNMKSLLIDNPNYGLFIPTYQRTYSWEEDNISRLVEDIIIGVNKLSIPQADNALTFIGTIITNKIISRSDSDHSLNEYYSIIDGQQRLTSLILISIALYLEISNYNKKLQNEKSDFSTNKSLKRRIDDILTQLKTIIRIDGNEIDNDYSPFPRMIRENQDKWSSTQKFAQYRSPIAWITFKFLKLLESQSDELDLIKFIDKLNSDVEATIEHKKIIENLHVISKIIHDTHSNFRKIDLVSLIPVHNKSNFFLEENVAQILTNQSNVSQTQAKNNQTEIVHLAQLVRMLFFSRFLINDLKMIVVFTQSDDLAFEVFEALNTTGQPLTAIETFIPKVIQHIGLDNFSGSDEDNLIANIRDKISPKGQKDKTILTKELIIAFALAETGTTVSNSLSEQIKFLNQEYDKLNNTQDKKAFLKHLSHLTTFRTDVWQKPDNQINIPNTIAENKPHTITDYYTILCWNFLIESNHTIIIPLISQYAIALMNQAEHNANDITNICEVIKAVTATIIIWKSFFGSTNGIDNIFRDLVKGESFFRNEIIIVRQRRNNNSLPSSSAIKKQLKKLILNNSEIKNTENWKNTVQTRNLYKQKKLAILILKMANMLLTVNKKGELVLAQKNIQGPKVKLITKLELEHIAPQNLSNNSDWDKSLYQNNDDIHRLGNLCILPKKTNQSLGNRSWEVKKRLYRLLACKSKEEFKKEHERLSNELACNISSEYYDFFVPLFEPIVKEKNWDLEAVNSRGAKILDVVGKELFSWLDEEFFPN